MQNFKKGIVLPFIIILASVALILGSFFLLDNKPKTATQTPTQTESPSPAAETTNWKTYTNAKLGFSFKYPPSFDLKNESNTDAMTLSRISLNQNYPYAEIGISLTNESLPSLESKNRFSKNSPDLTITIDNNEAKKFFGQTGVAGTKYGEEVFFSRNNISYYFSLVTDDQKEALNKILSTFKFVE